MSKIFSKLLVLILLMSFNIDAQNIESEFEPKKQSIFVYLITDNNNYNILYRNNLIHDVAGIKRDAFYILETQEKYFT